MPAPTIRSTSQQLTGSSSLAVAWPAGTVAGDTLIIFCSGQNQLSNPTGWRVLQNTGSANFWNNGGAFLKVMDAADITAGSVTFTTSGPVVVAAAVCFVGQVVYQGIETNWNNTNTATVTTNSYNPTTDRDVVLMFGSARASATPTCNLGTLAVGQNNGSNGASALYVLSPASAGLLASQFSYTGYSPQGYWQAVIVLSEFSSVSPPNYKLFAVTSSGPFSVPLDFDPSNNIVGCIGGGGAGAPCGANIVGAGAGGGGGNYSGDVNYPLIPGNTYIAVIGPGGLGSGSASGADGGDSSLSDGVTTILSAKGGKGAPINTSTAATPNPTAGSVGTFAFQGGKGGNALGSFQGGGGGGGGGGPEGGGGRGGDAGSGGGGGGGGGNGGGSSGQPATASFGAVGGDGGDNAYGVGHGSVFSSPEITPTLGGGGAGGQGAAIYTGGSDGADGSGGGSGGGDHIGNPTYPPGNYGGGSGGGGGAGGTPANGASGAIILAYPAPSTGCRYFCN